MGSEGIGGAEDKLVVGLMAGEAAATLDPCRTVWVSFGDGHICLASLTEPRNHRIIGISRSTLFVACISTPTFPREKTLQIDLFQHLSAPASLVSYMLAEGPNI